MSKKLEFDVEGFLVRRHVAGQNQIHLRGHDGKTTVMLMQNTGQTGTPGEGFWRNAKVKLVVEYNDDAQVRVKMHG